MKAAFFKRFDILKVLAHVEGCEIYAVNSLGQTFLDYAELDTRFFESVTALMNE